jgi:hypothetical protein
MLPSVVLTVAVALLTFASGCSGPSDCPVCGTTSNGTVGIIDIMPVPGAAGPGGNPFNVFDIGIVDPSTRRYYITDRSQNEVIAYDTVQDVAVATIGNGGFTGAICCTFRASNFNPLTGPNGIVITPGGSSRFGLLWAGDGDSTVKVFDAATGALVSPTQMPIDASGMPLTVTGAVTGVPRDPTMIDQCIRTGAGCGDFRADEMAFDPVDNILLVSNGDPGVPFVTLINTRNPACASNSCVLHQIFFNGTSTPGAITCPVGTGVAGAAIVGQPAITCASAPGGQGGIGGSVFNPTTGRFLVANTQNTSNAADGEVTEINPTTGLVTRSFQLTGLGCQVSSLAMGPSNKNVLVGCENLTGTVVFPPSEIIMDGGTGRIVTIIDKVGGSDEVWFNPGDNRYYTASRDMPTGPVLGVIDAGTNTWLQNVPTGSNAHSVAADPFNNHIFVPLQPAAACRDFSLFGCIAVYARQ